MTVRPAVAADAPALALVLVRAFQDDPAMVWSFPRARSRPRYARRFFAWELQRLAGQELTWTTENAAGAAIWALPNRWRESTGELLRLFAQTLLGSLPRADRVLVGLSRVEAAHPEQPHLYLAVLGVDPTRQGAGVGSALLAPGLELCDREALPAYLETAKERNVGFYARHGFRVTGELRMPGGPPVWLMWRDPA